MKLFSRFKRMTHAEARKRIALWREARLITDEEALEMHFQLCRHWGLESFIGLTKYLNGITKKLEATEPFNLNPSPDTSKSE